MRWLPLKRFCVGGPQYGLNTPASEYVHDGVRLIRTTDIVDVDRLTESSHAVFVSADCVRAEHRLVEGDLLFSRSGSLGRCYLHRGGGDYATFAGYLVRFRPCPELAHARYLSYTAQSQFFQDAVQADSTSSTIANFNAEKYAEIDIPHLPLGEQRAIADFLDHEMARFDALVNAKRRMLADLSERFDALRTLLISHGASESSVRQTGHPFFASIPSSWDLRSLSAVVDPTRPIVYGIVQPGPDIPSGVLYVKTGDLPGLDIRRMSRTSPEIAASYRRAELRQGDIVVAMRASIGTCALVPAWLDGGNLTQGTARVAPASETNTAWLMHALQSYPMKEQMLFRSVGTTYLTLNIADLRKVALPVPPVRVQEEISAELDDAQRGMLDTTSVLTRQLELLVEYRQALITAAVTGQIDIPGVTG